MPDPLTPVERDTLVDAARLIEANDPSAAAEKLALLIRSGSNDPDLLLTYSVACERLGLFNEAVGAAQAAIQGQSDRADLWAHLGRMLNDAQRPQDALNMLERAVALDPKVATYWYNLGVAAISNGLFERAVDALNQAVAIETLNAAAWGALGLAQQQAGQLEDSEESLRRAMECDRSLLSAAHNLGVTLRLLDRPSDALGVIDEAIRAGLVGQETQLLRAHLLADLGNFADAVSSYRGIIARNPEAIDAHEVLASLIPQVDAGDDALASYDESLRRNPSLELFRSALGAAWGMKQAAPLERWSEQALRQFGELADVQLMRGLALGLSSQPERALKIIEPLIAAGFGPALAHGAYYRLKLGDLRQAEAHALGATAIDFADQAAWAYLTVIWRLLEDPREQWLADYERLVLPVDLEAPEGFADSGSFMKALAAELEQLHATIHHPADQSLREGTQTRGNLFSRRSPLVRQLSQTVQKSVDKAIGSLPADPGHPFLSRNTGKSGYIGSWSVRLRSGGFHVSHIHQQGWLSSALYIDLPPEVTESTGAEMPPGALTFGVPDAELGIDLLPRRVERPQVGRLMLFPSYFWHGTVPFESKDWRLTVAFDAVPA